MNNFNTYIVMISLVWGLHWCKPLSQYDIVRMDIVNKINGLLTTTQTRISWNISDCEILVSSDGQRVIETFSCGSNVLVWDEKNTSESQPYGIIIKHLSMDQKIPGLLNIEDGCMAIIYEDPEKNILHGTTCESIQAKPITKKLKITT